MKADKKSYKAKRLEKAIIENADTLNFILAISCSGAWELNLLNNSASRSLGHDRIFGYKELLPQWTYEMFLEHVLPDDRSHVDRLFRDAINSGKDWNFECRIRRTDGAIRWIWAAGRRFKNEKGRPSRMIGIVQDITEQKGTENELRESERKFQLLAGTAEKLLMSPDPQAVVENLCAEAMKVLDCQAFFNYLVDEQCQRLHLNACAGIPEEEAKKIEWLDYGVAVCGCVAEQGIRIIQENILQASDLRTSLVRSYGIQAYCCHPLKTHDKVIGTLSFGTTKRPTFTPSEIEVMRTIADQVSAAMQRIQGEISLRVLNATLEQRVEERTSEIGALAGQLRELAAQLTLTEQRERQRLAKILHDHIQQMLVAAKLRLGIIINSEENVSQLNAARSVYELLDETLSASRTLTAELSPQILHDGGLGPALHWLARHALSKQGFAVALDFDASAEPNMEDERAFLFDAVREVLFNAIKHSGAQEAKISGFRREDGRICIIVSDDGKGFNPTWLNTGGKSEGFGLFSIQQRLRHMGGMLEIESAPEKGSRVSLIGPVTEESTPLKGRPPQVETAIETMRGNGNSGKIRTLLADDHHIMRQGLASLLRLDPDIKVIGEASDGAQAIDKARELNPDVIVMDISMPGINGIEATRQIRRELPRIQIIGLSMHGEGELSSAMLEAGAIGYVTKGGPPEALLDAIRSAVQLNQGDSPCAP